ncbi:MAG: hydrogenase maturation nickel metallochaperone HypA [Alphaproteobacteria bacterium]|nr:hydrogenase maturation nickel metallochaperone HypA [Alphaproteobacteria bacterium]
MHEASLIAAMMTRIERLASAENARRVTGVTVWLGALSHMSEAHFMEHFREAAADTIAEGAALAVTVSNDIHHPNAQDVVIESVEVES